jgi:hypothetical protein
MIVRVLPTFHGRVRTADFPGWDAEDYEAFLVAPVVGMYGTVDHVESHGQAPFTRYSVKFDDGTRSSGLVAGRDIKIVSLS